MAKAVWNGKVLAESEKTQLVEGNVYFPHDSIDREFFRSSSTISTCPAPKPERGCTHALGRRSKCDSRSS